MKNIGVYLRETQRNARNFIYGFINTNPEKNEIDTQYKIGLIISAIKLNGRILH